MSKIKDPRYIPFIEKSIYTLKNGEKHVLTPRLFKLYDAKIGRQLSANSIYWQTND
jgi:hypothetical protein